MNRIALLWRRLVVLAAPATSRAAVLTSGTLENASGAPAAGQVRVYAFELPTGDATQQMPLLGTASAGPDGQFAVTAVDDSQLLALAAKRGGWLDLTAVGDTPGNQAQWGFTVFVDAPGGTARVSTPDAVTTTATAARISAKHPQSPQITLHANRPMPFALAAQAGGTCDTKYRARKPVSMRKLAVVGELNNAYNDGTQGTFSYAREGSAETAFGVAANIKGSTWAISGETMITDQGKITFPQALKRYSRKLRTQFEFTKYQTQASSCAVWETEIRATSWTGGTDSSIKQDGLDACDTAKVQGYEPGATYDRNKGAATRYTRAVEAFGVNLTSRSGFSQNVTLDYAFRGPSGKNHYLCGPDGEQSAMESGRVFSGSKK